jgi:hypothetical protein
MSLFPPASGKFRFGAVFIVWVDGIAEIVHAQGTC